MKHTIVNMSDIAKGGFRLDPGYYLALARLREQQENGRPLLDHLKDTVPVEEAQAWLRRLPAPEVARRVAPLLSHGQGVQSAAMIVNRVASEYPHEALALLLESLDEMKAEAAQATQAAQAKESTLESLGRVRPSRRSHP